MRAVRWAFLWPDEPEPRQASASPFDALDSEAGPCACAVGSGDRLLARADAIPTLRMFTRRCALEMIHLWPAPDEVKSFLESGDDPLRLQALQAMEASPLASTWGGRVGYDAAQAARCALEDPAPRVTPHGRVSYAEAASRALDRVRWGLERTGFKSSEPVVERLDAWLGRMLTELLVGAADRVAFRWYEEEQRHQAHAPHWLELDETTHDQIRARVTALRTGAVSPETTSDLAVMAEAERRG
jgi:hypothetical protein